MDAHRRLTRAGLVCGLIVPVLYFGSQIAASFAYPGYSFLAQSASELGSNRSEFPAILNVGAMLTGLGALLAAPAFVRAMLHVPTSRILAWFTGAALVSTGLAAIHAGSYPLPDPRHNPGALGAGTFLLPFLFLAAFWKPWAGRSVKTYLIANVVLFFLIAPVMSGASGLPIEGLRGILQRLAAAVFYIPIGIVAWSLRR